MRDIKRIDPFLRILSELWKENPDLRFGQLVNWLVNNMGETDIFFPEEVDWVTTINSLKKDNNNY